MNGALNVKKEQKLWLLCCMKHCVAGTWASSPVATRSENKTSMTGSWIVCSIPPSVSRAGGTAMQLPQVCIYWRGQRDTMKPTVGWNCTVVLCGRLPIGFRFLGGYCLSIRKVIGLKCLLLFFWNIWNVLTETKFVLFFSPEMFMFGFLPSIISFYMIFTANTDLYPYGESTPLDHHTVCPFSGEAISPKEEIVWLIYKSNVWF